jgi:small subunit ribosomal protein S2
VAVVTMKQLLEAGVHFGHQTRRWNPKMRRFIFGERAGIYIIDLQQTLEQIDVAYRFVRDRVREGGTVLFVGTKKQAQEAIEREARRCNMPYVNFRWLGGMLTNFRTVHSRVAKLRELEAVIASGEVDQMPKKEGLKVRREVDKLQRNLGGIRSLETLPSVVFVIDTLKEAIAVTEAKRLGIPVVAVVDTNCDPDAVDCVIPGNDDAIRSANLMCRIIADAVLEGRHLANRDTARPATTEEEVVPVLDPEANARRREEQERARREAIEQQRRIEARVAQARAAGTETGAVSAPLDARERDGHGEAPDRPEAAPGTAGAPGAPAEEQGQAPEPAAAAPAAPGAEEAERG